MPQTYCALDRSLSGRYVNSSTTGFQALGIQPFSGKAIESQAFLRRKKVTDMVRLLGKMEGKVVKIEEVLFGSGLNVMGNVLLLSDLISLEEEEVAGRIEEK